MRYNGNNIVEVVEQHLEWIKCPDNDEYRADFSGASLVGVSAPYVNLYGANFRGANLFHACLYGAILERADFTGANLYEADLRRAKLRGAIGVGYIPQQIPTCGSFIAWKRATLDPEAMPYKDSVILKLRIPEDARRHSLMCGECKASKVEVLEVQTIDGEIMPDAVAFSIKDGRTLYRAGAVIEAPDYVGDIFNEHCPGIYFYLDRMQAVRYLTTGDDEDGNPQPIDMNQIEKEFKLTGLSGTPPQVLEYLVGDDLKELAFALKYLPDEEAAVVVLKTYDSYTPEVVARKLGKPVAEVEALWRQAKERMKKIVKEQHHLE